MTSKNNRILIIGESNNPRNIDLSNTILKTAQILKKLDYELYLVTENPVSILLNDSDIFKGREVCRINSDNILKIIDEHQIGSILPTVGDKEALNIITDTKIKERKIRNLGTNSNAAATALNRDMFSRHLKKYHLPSVDFIITNSETDVYNFVRNYGFPVIARRKYENDFSSGWSNIESLYDLNNFIERDPEFSVPVEIEKSIRGYHEYSITTMRDKNNNALMVGAIEDIQPIGIHHLDSLLITPTVSLTNNYVQKMRDAAIKTHKSFKTTGILTTHFAINDNGDFYITEIVPRLSEESNFLSYAYSYETTVIAAQLNVGKTFDETIAIDGNKLKSGFEPNTDHITARIPVWDSIKEIKLNPKKSSVGSYYVEGYSLENILKKGGFNRVINKKFFPNTLSIETKIAENDLFEKLIYPTNRQIFTIAVALQNGLEISYITKITHISPIFINAIKNLITLKNEITSKKGDIEILREAKQAGFSNEEIAEFWGIETKQISAIMKENNVKYTFKESSFLNTENQRSQRYLLSFDSNQNELILDTNPYVIIKTSVVDFKDYTEFRNYNYIIAKAAQSVIKNGYNLIIADQTINRSYKLEETDENDCKISDIYNELYDDNNFNNLNIAKIFNLDSGLSKEVYKDFDVTDVFEKELFVNEDASATRSTTDEYELLVLKSDDNWGISSYLFRGLDKDSKKPYSISANSPINNKLLTKEIDRFFEMHKKSQEEVNKNHGSEILNFYISINNDSTIVINKVTSGLENDFSRKDIASTINIIDAYSKLVIGAGFSQQNIEIDDSHFLNGDRKSYQIRHDGDEWSLFN